ncbi:MAG: MlaD family protein [Candidatus Sumerlaeota bacterium]|nr:MlaD family protein [Candidatus Sumerlaeota bacterium]
MSAMREQRLGGGGISTWLAMTVLLACLGGCGRGPADFGVKFKDAAGLAADGDVVSRGVKIGQVRKIDIEPDGVVARVRIEAKHADLVFRESLFTIDKAGGLLDTSGRRVLTMADPKGPARTPVKRGDVLTGHNSFSADPWAGSVDIAGKAFSKLAEMTLKAKQRWDAYAATPEGKEFIDSMKLTVDDLAAQGKEAWQSFRKENLPVIKAKAARLRDRLVELGKTDEASKFWKEFTDWSDNMEKAEKP